MADIRDLIFVYDPGGTSGFAGIKHINGRDFQLIASYEIPWEDRLKIFNVMYSNRNRIKTIIIERYRLFANPKTLHAQIGSEIPSARIIGIVELSAALCKLSPIIFQDPDERNNVSLQPIHAKLIGQSLKYPGRRSDHCLDAYLHGFYWILCNYRKLSNGKSK